MPVSSPKEIVPPIRVGHEQHHHGATQEPSSFWRSKTVVGLVIFFIMGAFLLMSEHRAHVLGFLPFLLLLACPLLHVFMHGGHGKHGGHDSEANRPEGGTEQ